MPQLHEMNSLCIHGQKSSAQVRLVPTWICTAGLGVHGEREIYSATAQGDEYGDQRESLSTLPTCGSFPKPVKWALLPACFFLEKANWEGGQLALSPLLWLGSVRGQISPKTSPMSTHSVGGSLLEGKGQVPGGNIKLSMATWMRLGKADQADGSVVLSTLFKLRQFYTKYMEKEIWMETRVDPICLPIAEIESYLIQVICCGAFTIFLTTGLNFWWIRKPNNNHNKVFKVHQIFPVFKDLIQWCSKTMCLQFYSKEQHISFLIIT